jgi:ATP-dependent DNA helicase DinG
MKKLRKLLKELKDYDDETGVIRDFEKYTDRLDSYFTNFKFVTEMADDNYIYWLSANPNKGHIKIVATPLKINNELEEVLYSNLDHIIFTSATIAIDDEFSYFKKSIGLKDRTLDKVIKSPFDYDKQMKVYIPKDIPMPNNKEFLTDISSFIIRLIEAAGGNTFLLFTSYSTLNYTYYLIREELEKMGHNLFIQGMAPRNKLIDMYKVSPKPVLFGTDSFWEGVDVKGEKLSSVIIVKLPFKVPSDPVVEAIIENMEKEGRNSFMEYQIPESIIKFKQGIGRLIRSKDDRGIITILDSRLYTKYYGKKFVNAIPTKNIFFRNRDEIV